MNGLRNLLGSLSFGQKFSILFAIAAIGGGLWWAVQWNRERDLRPLYSGLAAEDAGSVVDRLRTANVVFKVTETEKGSTILVPGARVAELRLELAGAGLPRTGRMGMELFDKTNFGTSDFAEQVNFRRALEGELERSIIALSEVERARVHVTFGKDSVFLESRQPAKASVMVKLRPHAQLSAQNVLAIKHLAASAVDGLNPDAVSVLDMNGNLLGKGRTQMDTEEAGSASSALDFRQNVEKDLRAKIVAALDPVLGPEKYRAGVTVDCDFTSGEQAEESFDPARSVMSSSSKTEDVSGGGSTGGVPGTATNLPRPPARTDAVGRSVARRTENIQFQSSRSYKRVKIPQGIVRRVSVAILVDHNLRWEGTGAKAKRILEPPPPERLKVVRDMIAGVAGIQTDRGDQLVVESLPFEATLQQGPPEPPMPAAPPPASGLPGWMPPWAQKLGLPVLIGIAAVTGLLLLGVPLFFLLRRKPKALPPAPSAPAAALPPGSQPDALPSPEAAQADFEERARAQLAQNEANKRLQEMEVLASLQLPATTKKAEVLKKHITEEAKKDPVVTAQLIRAWLKEQEQ